MELTLEEWNVLDDFTCCKPGTKDGRFTLLENREGDETRWHRKMQMILKIDGDLGVWAVDWERALTEYQEGYEPSALMCIYRVKPVVKHVTVYEKVDE